MKKLRIALLVVELLLAYCHFAVGQVHLRTSRAGTATGEPNNEGAWVTLPLVQLNGYFGVKVSLGNSSVVEENEELLFLLDTGSLFTMVHDHISLSGTDIASLGRSEMGLNTDGIQRTYFNNYASVENFQLFSRGNMKNSTSISFAVHQGLRYKEHLGNTELEDLIVVGRNYIRQFQWKSNNDGWIADGVLALSYPRGSPTSRSTFSSLFFNRIWQVLGGTDKNKFFIISNRKGSRWSPFLHIGSLEAVQGLGLNITQVMWSERQPTSSPTYHMAALFHVEICGVDLMYNTQVSNRFALVDSGALCLKLPEDMYRVATAWLPLDCPPDDVVTSLNLCTVNRGNYTGQLPRLEFKLSYLGEPLGFSLENLVFNSNGEEKLCMINGGTDALIIMGAMVLNAFDGVVFDAELNRVGFIPDSSLVTAGSGKEPDWCLDGSARCEHDERFNQIANRCEKPKCGLLDYRSSMYPTYECNSALPYLLLILLPVLLCSFCETTLILRSHSLLQLTKRKYREKLS